MKYFLALLFFLQAQVGSAQNGNYFLSNYSPSDDQLDNVCFQMVQDDRGLMYFATRSGVLQFDGSSWHLIKGNGAIYSLLITQDGQVYWSGTMGYGILGKDENELPSIKMISDDVRNVFQSVSIGNTLYFLNEEKISVYNKSTNQDVTIPSTELTGIFHEIFELFGSVFIHTSKGGVYRIEDNKLVKSSIRFPDGSHVIFSNGTKDKFILGLSNNKIYAVNASLKLSEISLEDEDYISRSVLVNGQWFNDNLFVLGTLRGGMVFINIKTGKTQEIINYSTGLPDNEIYALSKDKSESIWAAHEYGFTRIAPSLPFRSFNHYSGLQGNLLCAITYNNQVYVGTSVGLFKLEREDVFEEIIYYSENGVSNSTKETSNKKQSKPAADASVEHSKRKGFFSFLKRDKNKEETSSHRNTQNGAAHKKKTKRVLKTSRYTYKKIKNIEAKITQLLVSNNNLIATGLEGTFQINGIQANHISREPARYVFGTREKLLLISTYSDQVITLKYNGKNWLAINMLHHLNDQITHIFEGDDDELWLCALDKIYRLNYNEEQVNDIQVIEIFNPSYDDFVGAHWKNQTVLANAQGFFVYKNDTKGFEKVDSLSENTLTRYFAHAQNILYRDIHGWKLFGKNGTERNLGFLNLFQNLRYLSPDGQYENLWVITANNELYRFYAERVTANDEGFSILLKTFTNGDHKSGARLKYNINQDNSSVTIQLVQPNYLAAVAMEYRYKLDGLDETWTTWSNSNNIINFPYLPSGDYTLEVQSRDILGRTKEMNGINIEVLPPYWKRPWFYALEVLVFATFVILSFRLSARYRIISRLLMLLTIIMLIQFIETVVGETFETSTSPVIDFILQVIIAMLVLPIEGYLREMMLRSLEKNHRLKRFILQKQQSQVSNDIEEL